jgi:hypothetical protein
MLQGKGKRSQKRFKTKTWEDGKPFLSGLDLGDI